MVALGQASVLYKLRGAMDDHRLAPAPFLHVKKHTRPLQKVEVSQTTLTPPGAARDNGRMKKPPRNLPLEKIDFMAILHEMDEGDDRAAAVVAAGFLENNLAIAILSRFRELDPEQQKELCDNERSPLGTFFAKTRIGFALQLFGVRVKRDLDAIRTIRNQFAHHLEVRSFDHIEVKNHCDNLSCPRYLAWSSGKPEVKARRERFLATCSSFNRSNASSIAAAAARSFSEN
jgi:hypothetical protein